MRRRDRHAWSRRPAHAHELSAGLMIASRGSIRCPSDTPAYRFARLYDPTRRASNVMTLVSNSSMSSWDGGLGTRSACPGQLRLKVPWRCRGRRGAFFTRCKSAGVSGAVGVAHGLLPLNGYGAAMAAAGPGSCATRKTSLWESPRDGSPCRRRRARALERGRADGGTSTSTLATRATTA